jgi:ATP-dependent Clp protease protease subunit
MLRAKAMLDEIKEGIINAYEAKTGLNRTEISRLMNEESCFNAKKAVDLGFADGILYAENQVKNAMESVLFSRMVAPNSLLSKLPPPEPHTKPGTPHDQLERRINILKYSL